MGCVYLVTSPSGKQYVGKTVKTAEQRWLDHCAEARWGATYILKNAIRKYGPDAFRIESLFESEDEEELFAREIIEIEARKTVSPAGYNMTFGGDGIALTPEFLTERTEKYRAVMRDPVRRKEILDARAATMAKPEVKARRSASFAAYWENVSEADKQLRSDKVRESLARPEVKAKQAAGIREAFTRPDVKERHRAGIVAHCADPEVRKAMSKRSKEAMNRPEVKAKIAENSRLQWADPEARRKVGERTRAYYENKPEAREAHSVRMQEVMRRPEVKARVGHASSARNLAANPNVFADGLVFKSQTLAGQHFGITQTSAWGRINGNSPRFRWWHTIPNHNDPECDAVEECWAKIQWAAANPDHENVPGWLRPDRPKHGVAPAWAKRAAA